MKETVEWKQIFDRLIGPVDRRDPKACREAFERCVQYANKCLAKSLDYNPFLAEAAEQLGQERLHWDVVRSMVRLPEEARLNLVFEEGLGPVLTGNREGLRYLADVINLLSQSPMPGEHTAMDWDDPPFVGETNGLLVYLEDNSWFDGSDEDPDDMLADYDDEQIQKTVTQPDQVFALQFLVENPVTMATRPRRIYLVQDMKKYSGNDTWSKPIREDDSRMFVFTIRNDRGEDIEIALDLDDQEIMFLSREDVEQFLM